MDTWNKSFCQARDIIVLGRIWKQVFLSRKVFEKLFLAASAVLLYGNDENILMLLCLTHCGLVTPYGDFD